MKKHLLFFSLIFAFVTQVANAQVIFDPATVDASKLADGFDIVDIGGTAYLQVVLNDWNSVTNIPVMDIGSDVTSYTVDSKFIEGTSGFTFDQVNTFVKLMTISWGEINAYGGASTADFSTHTATIGTAGRAALLQIAGQETVNWGAVTGDTVYIGVITAVDGTVSEVDQSEIDGTNMENGFAWSIANYDGDAAVEDDAYYTFNYTGDTLAAGAGGSVRIEASNPGTGTQSINSLMYKKITVTGGVAYTASGAFRDITADSVSNFWCEVGLSPMDPSVVDSVHYIYGINTWNGCGPGLNGTFEDDYCKYDASYTIPGDGELTYYLVLLTGNWSDVADEFDVLVDELSINEVLSEAITSGNMEDSTAWTTYWRADNADTGSFKFNYTDDVPAAGDGGCLKINAFGSSGAFVKQAVTIKPGHSYALTGAFKNISVDTVTNSWLELILTRVEPIEDEEFGAGDAFALYELNSWMAPPANDLDFDGTFEENFNFRGGTYTKNLTIPDTVSQTEWFVLIKAGSSNGDGVATPNIEYLFDNISLMDLGVDTEAPAAPGNLVANAETITWDASTDNIGTYTYILFDGATAIDTIMALDTLNTYAFADLSIGTHTLGVVAADQSGNESTMTTVDTDIVVDGIENHTLTHIAIFPNPSTGFVNINAESASIITLKVYNMAGMMIMSDDFINDYQLDMTDANSGMYYIHLKTENGVQVEKIIIQ